MKKITNGRTLVYTVCDEKYTQFIPLLIMSHMLHNDDIDVEIGTNLPNLNDSTEKAVQILRDYFKDKGKIQIDYNVFNKDNGTSIYNGYKVTVNSVRFIATPKIKNEYTYITDIDIACLEALTQCHIDDMRKHNSNYSNIVRKDTIHLSGLHFVRTDSYFPVEIPDNVNTSINDEILLYKITEAKGEPMDRNRTFRPVHGVHFSPNRPKVGGGNGIPGWAADKWKKQWENLENTDIYKIIYPLFDDSLKIMIGKLKDYYDGKEK